MGVERPQLYLAQSFMHGRLYSAHSSGLQSGREASIVVEAQVLPPKLQRTVSDL